MKTRLGKVVGLVMVGAMVLSACASDDGGDTDDTAAEGTDDSADDSADAGGDTFDVRAILPQGTDQPYGTTYLPPFEETAAELGMNLTIANTGYDGDAQASECEVAIAAQPDGIILWPAVASQVRPCLLAAQEAGIPVTITNSDVLEEDADLTEAYSGPDTYGQGVASAELMCSIVGDEPTGIIMVNGATGNTTAIDRENGFEDTINEQCPNVEILARQPGDWDKDQSQIAASEMITAVGIENIDGAYAADDTMVAGVIDALRDRDVDVEALAITSIGNTELGNPLVIEGVLDGTVFQSSSWDGENAASTMYDVLTDNPDERIVKFMPDVKVTADNADDPAVAPEW